MSRIAFWSCLCCRPELHICFDFQQLRVCRDSFFKKREIFSLIKSVSSYNKCRSVETIFFKRDLIFFSHTIILWSVYSAGSSTSKNISDLIMLVVYSLLQALIKNTLQFTKSRSASSPPSSHRDHPRRVPHVRLIKEFGIYTVQKL